MFVINTLVLARQNNVSVPEVLRVTKRLLKVFPHYLISENFRKTEGVWSKNNRQCENYEYSLLAASLIVGQLQSNVAMLHSINLEILRSKRGLSGIVDIDTWFSIAKPKPTPKDLQIQLGCFLEEVNEVLASLGVSIQALDHLATYWKTSPELVVDLPTDKRVEFLDGLVDVTVTAVGSANYANMNFPAALSEVNDSNFSKFEDNAPVFNEQSYLVR